MHRASLDSRIVRRISSLALMTEGRISAVRLTTAIEDCRHVARCDVAFGDRFRF